MPYIRNDNKHRDKLVKGHVPVIKDGELNYLITHLCHLHIMNMGGLNYDNINAVIGVLECAKLELYRMVAAPYEDNKKEINGHISCLDYEWTDD